MTDANDSARIGAGKVGHTPGPWFTSMDYSCETLVRAGDPKNGMRIATTFASHANQANAETRLARIRTNEANARLIAAAPDLLEALTMVRDSIEAWTGYNDDGFDSEDMAVINAAIAKATGAAS